MGEITEEVVDAGKLDMKLKPKNPLWDENQIIPDSFLLGPTKKTKLF